MPIGESDWTAAPSRLKDLIRYTQRFRLTLVLLFLAWFVVFHVVGLTPEAGPAGTWVLGAVLVTAMLVVALIPILARWWVKTRRPINGFYALLVLFDTVMTCLTVQMTGGGISVAFAVFYFMAVGNGYMFDRRGLLISNTFMAVSYVVTLLVLPEGGGAPTLLDWVDILLMRIPLIYIISAFAVWLAQRGHQAQVEDQRRYLDTLQGFLKALEARDGYTRQHSVNVARWAATFAHELGASQEELEILLHAGELHDIGKIGVPDGILNKPGKLTAAEYARMREHPQIGVEITRHVRWFTKKHLEVVKHHHERWDGKGYPDGLAAEAIPYLARITALCDVFDAVTNHRPYRPGLRMTQAFDLIASGHGTQFDPALTDRFLEFLADLLAFLRRHLPATNFTNGTWVDGELHLTVQLACGEVIARVARRDSEWVWLGVEEPTQAGELQELQA